MESFYKLDTIIDHSTTIGSIDLSILDIPQAPYVCYPHPQLLDPTLTDEELVNKLQNLYFVCRSRWFCGSSLSRSSFHKSILKSAKFLIQKDFAPRAWLLWSIWVWRNYDGKDSYMEFPPINWVWSTVVMEKYLEWFTSEHHNYFIPHLIQTKAYKKLLEFQTKAYNAVLLGGMPVEKAKLKYLPLARVRNLYTKALEEAAQLKHKALVAARLVDLPDYIFVRAK